MYRKAENKDLVIKKIENILHKNSIDCILNKYGNILTKSKVGEYYLSELAPGYEDGSRECMYDKCNYSCNVDETELPTDKSTFDISFVSRQVQMIKLNIKKLFEKDVIYSLDSILSRIKKDKEIVYYSLNDMIKTKEIVYDKFNRPGKIRHITSKLLNETQLEDNLKNKPKVLKDIEENKLQFNKDEFDEDGLVDLNIEKWKGSPQYFIFQPIELDDDNLDIRWRGVPLGWNPGKIELPNIEYSKSKKLLARKTSQKIIIPSTIKTKSESYFISIENRVLDLQKKYFTIDTDVDPRSHFSYNICVGSVLDNNYTLVSSEGKIGQVEILENLLTKKINNQELTPIMNAILKYLKIYCFGRVNDFIGNIKSILGEKVIGHLMYGSLLLNLAKPKKKPEWVLDGSTDYFVARVYTDLGWKNSQISLANTLPISNSCNNAPFYGFINCVDGRSKLFDSNVIGKDSSFKFKKSTDTGTVGRSCSTKPDEELKEVEKYLNVKQTKGKINRCLGIELKLREYDLLKYQNKRWFYRWSELNLKC